MRGTYELHWHFHCISADTVRINCIEWHVHWTFPLHMRCLRNFLFAAIIIGNLESPLSFCRVWQSTVLISFFVSLLSFCMVCAIRHLAWTLQNYHHQRKFWTSLIWSDTYWNIETPFRKMSLKPTIKRTWDPWTSWRIFHILLSDPVPVPAVMLFFWANNFLDLPRRVGDHDSIRIAGEFDMTPHGRIVTHDCFCARHQLVAVDRGERAKIRRGRIPRRIPVAVVLECVSGAGISILLNGLRKVGGRKAIISWLVVSTLIRETNG